MTGSNGWKRACLGNSVYLILLFVSLEGDASFPGSPLIDVEGVSGDEEDGAPDQDEEVKSQDDEKE